MRHGEIMRPLPFIMFILCILCGNHAAADTYSGATPSYFPDYYNEFGIKSTRNYDSIADYEAVDPFTGAVKLQHVDVFIPGDGGADIKIERSYTSPKQYAPFGYQGWQLGHGWSLHMGRLWHTGSGPCEGAVPNVPATLPVLESGDGVRHIMYVEDVTAALPAFRSLDGWRGNCEMAAGATSYHFVAHSPDGVRYDYEPDSNWRVSSGDEGLVYAVKITWPSQNYLTISYAQGSAGSYLLQNIQGYYANGNADGRVVAFDYTYANMGYATLWHITYNNAKLYTAQALPNNLMQWTYNTSYVSYEAPDNTSIYFYLDSVTDPNGETWHYQYDKTYNIQTDPNLYMLT